VDGVSTDFNFTLSTSCLAPFTVTFQNLSSGPGNITYTWDFGNGNNSTAANPSTVYNTPGTYTVTLTATSDLGCSGTIQKTITIVNTVTDFTAPATVCVGQPVAFKNNSSAPALSSLWDFGDGTSSAQINPVKTFLTAGTYTVHLSNQYANCTDAVTKTITVIDNPVADFKSDDSASCSAPFNVQFTDLTPGATAWQWNFGDGGTSTLPNPTHQYTSLGNFTVTLIATVASGCSDTVTKTSFIQIQEPVIQLNVPTGGCAPFSYTPSATISTLDPISSYLWDMGDGTTYNVRNPPAHIYANTGNYTVSLAITTVSGCTKKVTVVDGVLVGILPVPSFTVSPAPVCAGDTYTFTGSASNLLPNSNIVWQWNFGDGSPSGSGQTVTHQFTDAGNITVTLTVLNNGCPGIATQTFTILPPVAKFEYLFDCTTRTATFTDQSIVDVAVSPLTYEWDFGDGGTSSSQNPTHVYSTPGSYLATLKVTNGSCSYTYGRTVIIANEVANFTTPRLRVCKNEPFTLTATGSNPANIATYTWGINGQTVITTSPTFTTSIATAGPYDVTLTLTDINGCITTKTVTNYITVTGPVANFVPATPGGCFNKTTTFTDLSTPAGTITSWQWDFGDGTQQTFTAAPFTHIYNSEGSYTISLRITDNAGCTDAYTLPASFLVTNPIVGFKAPLLFCPMAPLPFTDTSSGVALSYVWTFGDGNTSTLKNPSNAYPTGDADYTVKLKITDIAGCSDSVSKTDYIKIRTPKAAFTIKDTASICLPLKTSFTFEGADYSSFYWDFGDGGTSTAQNPTYFYNSYGHFTPTLHVLGAGGCESIAQASVTVYDPANVQINYGPLTTACNSLNVDFDLVMPPGFKFIFYFGDGTIDSSRRTSFSHFYSRPSFNTPILVITDTLTGCISTIIGNTRIDVLGAVPLFAPDKDEFCDNATVSFRNFTTKNEPIISTQWDFGDGANSSLDEPMHTYTQPGTYVVTLNVTTQSNCSKSFADTIYVYRTPVASIIGRDTICLNIPEAYNGLLAQSDTLTYWKWDTGNGQTPSTQNINLTYNTTGNHTLTLTTTNKIGCSSTTTKTIYVAPLPTATPVQNPLTIISGAGTNLAMTYTGNIRTYTWTPATKLSCTDCPTPYANPQFSTTYRVNLEDRYGCRNYGDITVNVICNNQNFFVPNTFSPNNDGTNDVFYPRGTGLFNIKSMRIFNRWGELVFEKLNIKPNDITAGWDGKYKGVLASPDVYVFTIEILCDNNTLIPVKGNVTLLR